MKEAHIVILNAFDDLKFNIGKKTLADFLKGDPNPTISKNNLEELESYGSLFMLEKTEIFELIDILIKYKYLELKIVGQGFQVVCRTQMGLKEIYEKKFDPSLVKCSPLKTKMSYKVSKITNSDRELFKVFDFFLKDFNDEQKQSIIANYKNILCIAGAGSGKTTVLTKRIEFLCKFKSIPERKILAVTFTRKAKEEMQTRLEQLDIRNANVETFNSFSEKILKKYQYKLHKKNIKVAQFKDKISIIKTIMKQLGISFENIIDDYFNKKQLREKSKDELFLVFVSDLFSIVDFYKILKDNNPNDKNSFEIKPFFNRERNSSKRRTAQFMYKIALEIDKELKKRDLRDFTDQILDTISLFENNHDLIPKFDHVLIDEFQDANQMQIDLIKLLNPKFIFAVGDPRQAIYGWRGSQIKYILDFPHFFANDCNDVYKDTQIIELKTNYRSVKQIVDFFNISIKRLKLAYLIPHKKNTLDNSIFVIEQENELLERRFVLEAIKNSSNPLNEIFVLARTNKILDKFAHFFAQNGINFKIKNEENYNFENSNNKNQVTLATIHSIKGMQAKEVYIVSCNNLSFPNKVVDNFVFSHIKDDFDYDKEDEEERLFYVGLSRAKEKLIITYTGKKSKFLTSKMLKLAMFKPKNQSLFDYATPSSNQTNNKNVSYSSSNPSIIKALLKEWRVEKANKSNLPLYMIISNMAIDDIARIMPQNKVDLLNVKGLGTIKIGKYGEEILRIVNGA